MQKAASPFFTNLWDNRGLGFPPRPAGAHRLLDPGLRRHRGFRGM